MKKRVTLFLTSLLVGLGMSAQATVEWEKPVPSGSEIVYSQDETGQLYYLYSEEGDFFFTPGNWWGTQTSKGSTGNLIYFFKYQVNGEWDGQTLIIRNWLDSKNRWDEVFITYNDGAYDGQGAYCFVTDCDNRGNNLFKVEEEDGKYMFYTTCPDPDAEDVDSKWPYSSEVWGDKVYIGSTDDEEYASALWPTGMNDHLMYVEPVKWSLVTQAAYRAYREEAERYEMAQQLRDEIEAAEEGRDGIDLSEVWAVYNNTASTIAQMKDARQRLVELVQEYAASHGSVTDPIDLTNAITNPDYGASGNGNGWLGTAMTVSDGCAELWNEASFDAYQDLKNMPNGIYKLNLHGLYRVGTADNRKLYDANGNLLRKDMQNTYLYAKSGGVTYRVLMKGYETGLSEVKLHDTDYHYTGSDLYGPDRRAGFSVYNEEGHYNDNDLYIPVTDGEMRIGLVNEKTGSQIEWCVFDDWNLTFYGNTWDAYEMWREDFIDVDYSDVFAQKSLIDAITEAIETVSAAETKEEVLAQYAQIQTLKEQIRASEVAYENYKAAIEVIKAYMKEHDDFAGADRTFLEDYLDGAAGTDVYPNGSYSYIISNATLTPEELEEETKYAQALLQTAIEKGIIDGSEITNMLKNPDMSSDKFAGWTVAEGTIDGNFNSGMGHDNYSKPSDGERPHVGQVFNKNFNIYQTLTNMPEGVYEVNLNALYRGGDRYAEGQAPIVLYLNDFQTPIQDIKDDLMPEDEAEDGVNCFIYNTAGEDKVGTWPYDDIYDGGYGPNSVNGCSYAFYGGRYKQTVYGLVTDGVLKIGARDTRTANWVGWGVFTNFRLTYRAKNPAAIDAVLDNFNGRLNGLYALEDYFDQKLLAQLEECIQKGQASTNSEEKYTILIEANNILTKINPCIEAYKELTKLMDLLSDAYEKAVEDGIATDEEYDEFMFNTYDEVMSNIADGAYTMEEVEELIEKYSTHRLIDFFTVSGDMAESNWGQDLGLYRLERQEDGTYVGTFELLDRTMDSGYSNRSGFFLTYQGVNYDCPHPNDRRITGVHCDFDLRPYNSGQWFAGFGGKWKATVNAERTKIHFEPVGKEALPNYAYIVGDIPGDVWVLNRNHALSHQGNGVYTGTFTTGSKDGRVTIYGGGYGPANDNWNDNSRYGCGSGTLDVATDTLHVVGDTINHVYPFYGDTSWKLKMNTTYNVTFDLGHARVIFAEVPVKGEGTEEAPYELASANDVAKMRSLMKLGETTYFKLTSDVDLKNVAWSALNTVADADTLGNTCLNYINFDGQNHIISNVSVKGSAKTAASFFGVLCGAVRNVGFQDVRFESGECPALITAIGAESYTGTSYVENVFVTGTAIANGYTNADGKDARNLAVAALAANVDGAAVIRNCYARMNINDAYCAVTGGLVGNVAAALTMENCYSASTITTKANNIIGAVEDEAPAGTYKNIVVWNEGKNIFGPARDEDKFQGVILADDSDFATLQKTVVGWDESVWYCTMAEGEYPTFQWCRPELAVVTVNPYAFGLTSEVKADAVAINYELNAVAKGVSVVFYNAYGSEVTTVALGGENLTEGAHSVSIARSDINENARAWSIVVEGKGVAAPTVIGESMKFWNPEGMAVDYNVESPYFGRLYVSESTTVGDDDETGEKYISSTEVGNGSGLYVLDPYMKPVLAANGKAGFNSNGMLNVASEEDYLTGNIAADPKTVRISKDGRIFLGRGTGKCASTLLEVNPADLNAEFTPVIVGGELEEETETTGGGVYLDGEYQTGMMSSFATEGEGENLKIYTLTCDLMGAHFDKNSYFLHRIDLGTATSWNTVPSEQLSWFDGYTVAPTAVSIESDGQGGLWYFQYRDNPKASEPSIKHVSADGVEDFSEISRVCRGGCAAFSADGKYMVYAIEKNMACLNEIEYTFAGPIVSQLSLFSIREERPYAMAFDYAGNLFCCSPNTETLNVYALPSFTGNVVETPAASKYALPAGTGTGIQEIAGETQNTNGLIFDLSGRRVNNAQHGIYIMNGKKVYVK